jgi:uncharacterized repeat protein (TIGR03803 family)
MVSLFALAMLVSTLAVAQTETVLYTFSGGSDGGNPYAGPILDNKGNLYGTTVYGGAYNWGAVFKLSPDTNGQWMETVLHSFNSDGQDGIRPYSSLVMDPSGNLYGTTNIGGAYNYGTVFRLHPNADGSWTETVLHSFNADGTDGNEPYANLIFDKLGNLYGTTYYGGSQGEGTVFQLSPGANGTWLEQVILSFNYADGAAPYGGLVLDSTGVFYGATNSGGTYQHGVVFSLKRGSNGAWIESVLHTFNPSTGDGWAPYAGLVIDKAGHLYGTTLYGGNGSGTVFELAHVNGNWVETLIHNFTQQDGINPYSPLVIDASGNLYGTTWQSLINNVGGAGIVFELSQTKPNVWQETVLHNFVNPGDGGNPYSGVALDGAGHVYGTTYWGGVFPGTGVVFKVTPRSATTTTLSSSLNPSIYGQAVTFTAKVTSSLGAPPNGETVTFMKGTTTLATAALSGGSASFTSSTLPAGAYGIKAVYGGDANLANSTSSPVIQTVNKATTTTSLTSSQNPSSFGQSVTFTAQVVSPQYSGTVSGQVTFKNGTTALGTVTLSSGVAKYTTSKLPVGTNPITATYNGNPSFVTSTSNTVNQVVK